MQNVLELMLYSLCIHGIGIICSLLGALFWKKSHPSLSFWSMLLGDTILLIITENKLPLGIKLPSGCESLRDKYFVTFIRYNINLS
jgi:SSS family solute:Na+ symporter